MQAIRDYSTFMPVMSGNRFGSVLFQRAGYPVGFSGNVPFETNLEAVTVQPGPDLASMAGALELPLPGMVGVESFPSLSASDLDSVLPEDWMQSRLGDLFKKFAVYFFALLLVGAGILFFVVRPATVKAAVKAAV